MPARIVLLDTSFILALENRDDAYHEKAKSLDRELTLQEFTYLVPWAVLIEIADGYARIGRRHKALQLLDRFQTEEGYVVESLTVPMFQQALSLYRSRPDKEWGLTDCISFVVMDQWKTSIALTADVHFRQAGFTALLLEP